MTIQLVKSVQHELCLWLKREIEKQFWPCNFLETKDDCVRFCIDGAEIAMIDFEGIDIRLWLWDSIERYTWGDDNISVPKVSKCMGWRCERFELADPISFDKILKKMLLHFDILRKGAIERISKRHEKYWSW